MRRMLLPLVGVPLLLLLPAAGDAVWRAGWTPASLNDRCWGSVCVVLDSGYWELSGGEYKPWPATVPSVAPPVLPPPGP